MSQKRACTVMGSGEKWEEQAYGISKHRLYIRKRTGDAWNGKRKYHSVQKYWQRYRCKLQNLVGGEMKAYTEMMNEARDLAIQRMVEEAEGLGADAVVNIRFATSAIIQGAAEVIAYGTAVKFVNK